MTISSSTRKAGPFNGNDATTVFPFAFKVFTTADIALTLTDTDGVETALVLDTDYTVVLNGDQDNDPGGDITYPMAGSPLATGEILTVIGDLAELQPTEITNGGGFFPKVIERALDRIVIFTQQLREEMARTIKFPVSDDALSTELPTAGLRANKALVFDANGNVGVSTDDFNNSAAAAAASAAAAAASYDLFDDRFLGSKTTDPALDNDGNALAEGTLYWNSVANEFRLYNGATWQIVVPAGNLQKITYVAGVDFTAGVTTTLTLPTNPLTKSNLDIVFDAAWQQMTEFELSGTTVTFDAAIPVGVAQVEISYTTPLQISTVSDGVVTNIKVAADADIESTKLVFSPTGAGAIARAVQAVLNDNANVVSYGCVADGNAATFTGTDNSAALQAIIDNAIAGAVVTQGGATVRLPSGVICLDDPIVCDSGGVSFLRIIGNGNSTRLIYRGSSGTGLSFIGGSYDGTYGTFNSRITLENLMVFCQPAEVAAGDTRGLSFIYCAEVKLTAVSSHYAHEAFYIKDTPLFITERCEAINSYIGLSHKKSTTFADADLAGIVHNNLICSGNTIDVKIDGGRDIKLNGCTLASTQALNIRATGSTSASDQVELVQLNGCFLDYQDLTTPAVQIGDPADTTFQIKKVELNGCYYASSASFTKDIIHIDSPLVINVSINGGYCSEVVPDFVAIGSSCLSTLQVSIDGIGANNCFKYRIRDERSVTQRSELFQHPPSLQLNPDFLYYPAGGYFPFGFDQTQVGSIARYTTAFVTGDAALTLSGAGNPNPPAACVWLPVLGDISVEQGTDLVIEWVVIAPTTAAKSTLFITTTNIDGTGSAETVADPVLTSVVQEFTNTYVRLVHAYKVPNNKVVTSVSVHGAVGETLRVDYFAVYGPVKYRPSEMLYIGAAADFADANFKIAKFRGQKAAKRLYPAAYAISPEADEIYTCRKDVAGTYSWQLIA